MLLVLAIISYIQAGYAEVDYSKLSQTELNKAFVAAVQKNVPEEVKKIIEAGADVTTPIPYVWTHGDCDWNAQDTLFTYALRSNHPEMLKVVKIEKNELNQAWNFVIQEGYLELVKELIRQGADINFLDKDRNTPLIIAIQHGRPTSAFATQSSDQQLSRWQNRQEIIQAILKAGACVAHTNTYGRTALMEAVINNDLYTVQTLLQIPEMLKGSYWGFGTKPINYADKDGNTALILAIKHVSFMYHDSRGYNTCLSSQNIVNALLNTPGINTSHTNNKGETAIKLYEQLKKSIERAR